MQEPIFLLKSVVNSFVIPESVQLRCEGLVDTLDINGCYLSNSKVLFEFYNLLIPYIDDPSWCWRYGEQIDASDMDSIHLALITCESVSDFLGIGCNYSNLYTTVSSSLKLENNCYCLKFKMPDIYRNLAWFHIHVISAYVVKLLTNQFGINIENIKISVPLPKESNLLAPKLREIYSQSDNTSFTISIPASLYTNKNIKYNSAIHSRAIDECKIKASVYNRFEKISGNILAIFMRYSDQLPLIEEVAQQLDTSARNMRKKLAEENTSFKKLAIDYKFFRSCHFLKHSNLHIDEIGYKAGYSCPSNFRRAFVKMFGMTPSSYRKDHQSDSP